MITPRVAIAMAVYKPAPEVFREQLESIRAQTLREWICFVSADSPLDEVLSDPSFQTFRDDPRFVWRTNPVRLGHPGNFEHAIQLAAESGASAIACSDQDDVWYPQKLEQCVQALEEAGPRSLVHSDLNVLREGRVDPRSSVWQIENRKVAQNRPWQLYLRNIITGCTMMFDAELARQHGKIPRSFEHHDHWFGVVASSLGQVRAIHEPLIAYRQHATNVVGVIAFNLVPKIRSFAQLRERLRLWRADWLLIRARVEGGASAGLRVPRWFRWILESRLDPGLGLVIVGATYVGRDTIVAKTMIRIGVGKIWNRFGGS